MLIILIAVLIGVGIKDKMNQQERNQIEKMQVEEPEYIDVEHVDAPYEHWLAAAVMISVSMDYPDFELQKIYMSGETDIECLNESAGVYVTYITGGEEKCVFSKPIDALRNEEGTFDIYAEYIGYATYDEISIGEIDNTNFETIEIENIGTLIEQLERVSKYMN